jgi:predicted nucleic acid-binding protein
VTIVSNTSPIINLAAIGQLNLLQQLYGRITIPREVYHEIVVIGAGEPGAREVEQFGWISTVAVADQKLASSLGAALDPGEAEAIACAVEVNATLLLIDEHRGRAMAKRLGIPVIGILGVLIEAKHRGLINTIKPLLDDLITRAGFWIRSDLYSQILMAGGEDPPPSG